MEAGEGLDPASDGDSGTLERDAFLSALSAGIVPGAIYTSEAIFVQEIERIFHDNWIYLCHESEVPVAGDYVRVTLGSQPVIVTRLSSGRLAAFFNRCRHRGNTVCEGEAGNSLFFRCQYHGWTYANDGRLVGMPLPNAYPSECAKADLGLVPLAKLESYRGFVFGSLSLQSPVLVEFLANARAMIDLLCDLSPQGEITLAAGKQRTVFDGNWKFVGMDGYHFSYVHRSLNDVLRDGGSYSLHRGGSVGTHARESSGNLAHDLGNGHVRLDTWPSRSREIERHLAPLRETTWGRKYLGDMERAHGRERAHMVIALGSPHTGIWPNLQMIDVHVRRIIPVSVARTEVEMSPVLLEGAPHEVNAERLRKHEFGYGPCGFVSPDDFEIFERNQMGLGATGADGVRLQRGIAREVSEDDGTLSALYADEITQRGQLKAWAKAIFAEPMS